MSIGHAPAGQSFGPYNVDGDLRDVVACEKCLEPGPVFAFLHPERRARDDAPVWRLRFTHARCSTGADRRVPWQVYGPRFGPGPGGATCW